jgi:hypothetical protein
MLRSGKRVWHPQSPLIGGLTLLWGTTGRLRERQTNYNALEIVHVARVAEVLMR